jgi:hypothetical protein
MAEETVARQLCACAGQHELLKKLLSKYTGSAEHDRFVAVHEHLLVQHKV